MPLLTFLVAECDICCARSTAFLAAIYSRIDAWQMVQGDGWTRRNDSKAMGLVYRCPDCTKAKAGRADNGDPATIVPAPAPHKVDPRKAATS